MQRLRLINSYLSCAATWAGAVLYGVPRYNTDHTCVTGYWVHFPHAVGDKQKDGAGKAVWYHESGRVRLLEPLLSMDKQRYTLVSSDNIKGETVFAKVIPSNNGCIGCSFQLKPCALITPPCTAGLRHDEQEVIFITEVSRW